MRPCPNRLIQLLLRRANSLCSLSAPPEPVYFWVCGGRTPENHFGRRDKKLVQGLSMAFLADQRELRYTTCWLFGDYLGTTWGTTWRLLGDYLETTWGLLGDYLGTTWGLLREFLGTESMLKFSLVCVFFTFCLFEFCHFHQPRLNKCLRVTK